MVIARHLHQQMSRKFIQAFDFSMGFQKPQISWASASFHIFLFFLF